MLSSLSPARRRLVLTLVVAVLVAVLIAVILAVVSSSGGSSKPAAAPAVAQDVAGPVLLVPGYGGSTTSLAALATRLRAEGKDATVVSLPDSAQGDLAAQATVLGAAVTAALSRTGAASVDIVGYSAGGVVTRIWLKDDGGAAVTRRVVTLGSPQHGTAVATLGSLFAGECPVACQQLVPGSSVLSALNAGSELPAGPQVVSLYTSSDQVVVPPESAVLTGALNIEIQSVCASSTVNHTQLPSDHLVGSMVLGELGTSAVAHYTAADCARLSA